MIRTSCLVLALGVLSACVANRPADPNPNSVPNVMLSITQTRQTVEHIHMAGGLYDGAAAGQTANFVVTRDDMLVCTFQTDPVFPGDGTEIQRTAHRLNVPGLYSELARLYVPNVAPVETSFTSNFMVETGGPSGLTTTPTGFGDPRFEQLQSLFQARPTPCWAFG